MYFFFSKVLAFLIVPFYWILALVVIALIIKNKKAKRRLCIAAISLTLLFSMPVFLNQFANHWDVYPPQADNTKYSCVIVLGGFAGPGKFGTGYFGGAADRFIQGAKLKTSGKAKYILFSGANGSLEKNDFIEADWARAQLKELNYPDSVILTEGRSKNTLENAKFSNTILQQKHLAPPYLLVTSAFHMRRAMATFKKAGVPVVPYPCNFIAGGRFSFIQLIPKAEILPKWDIYTKELVGYAVLWFK